MPTQGAGLLVNMEEVLGGGVASGRGQRNVPTQNHHVHQLAQQTPRNATALKKKKNNKKN